MTFSNPLPMGIAEGKLVFSDEDGEIVMEPEGLLRLKLTATQEENQHRISLRIVWQSQDASPRKGKALTVRAGSKNEILE